MGSVCLHMGLFAFLPYRSFAYIIWLQVRGFYWIPEYVNVCVSASVGISGAFSLLLFLDQLFWHVAIFSVLIYLLISLGCLFVF